jgi:hypothetical protein
MFHTPDWFTTKRYLHPSEQYEITVATGQQTLSKYTGTLNLNKHYTFTDALYVPGLKQSLISVTGLNDQGFNVIFNSEDNTVQLQKNGETWTIGVRQGSEYKLCRRPIKHCAITETHQVMSLATQVTKTSEYRLWHSRFNHVSPHRVKQTLLVHRNILLEVPTKSQFFCDGCAHGKSKRRTFSPSHSSHKPGEVCTSDLMGPFEVVSTDKHDMQCS